MKKYFFLIFVLLTGCIPENSKPIFKINDKLNKFKPSSDTDEPPRLPVYNIETLASLAAEQVIKNNPTNCKDGWELKNPSIIDQHYKKVKDVLNRNSCLSCHNASSVGYANLNYSSTLEMLDKKGASNNSYIVNPTEIQKSLILNKLANYSGSMPGVSKSDLTILKEWVKSIDYVCLTDKEVVKEENIQIKTADATIDNKLTTYSTTKSTRSTSSLKVLIPGKAELTLTISEMGANIITGESVNSVKNLTSEVSKIKFKMNTSYVASVKNKILKLDESILYTSFDGLSFKINQTLNLDLNTGIIAKEAITQTNLPAVKKKEINGIETTVTTTGKYNNGISTITQKTKTLSKADNSFAVKDRTYVIDSNQLTFTEAIVDFGPKSTIATVNGVKTEITIISYLKDGKTYIEKKIIKTLADGTFVNGSNSGGTIIGSSLTVSIVNGDSFTFTITPIVAEPEKEVITIQNKQIKTADATIDNTLTTYTTTKSTRSTSSLKVLIPGKAELTLTISEMGANIITGESVNSVKNLTSEVSKIKFKMNTSYVASVKNKILKLDESILHTSFDGLSFKINQTLNLDLNTGIIAKEAITQTDLPAVMKKEINSIETTVTTTGKYSNGISTITQKTKTLSKADNSFAVKDRVYVIDSNQLTFTEAIVDFGPKSTISTANGVKTEITIISYLKDGKTYIEKKIMKTLADGTVVNGSNSGGTIVGSSLTVSIVNGDSFTFTITPIIVTPPPPPPTTETLASLAAEQTAKTNPASCGFGWELKNPTVINEHFNKVKNVLNNNSCLNCHGASVKGYASLSYSSTQEMLDKKGAAGTSYLVNPLEIQKSLILNELGNYGGSMPTVSKSDLTILKDWVKSIDYVCLTDKEIVKEENIQVKTTDATIDNKLTTYSTSLSKRSTSELKVLIPGKVQLTLTIAETGTNTITSESINSITNLTKEEIKIQFKTNTSYVASVKNKVLTLNETILYTSFDGLIFKLNQTHSLDLNTAINTKGAITQTDLPAVKKKELNSIETTVTTTGKYTNGVSTITQKTKTQSLADNTFTIKDRIYVIDSSKLTFTESISDFGPKSTISTTNGIKSEITVTSYLKDGKTYLEKKIMKTLPDGTVIDGAYSGNTVIGSSLTTSIIIGETFSFTITPIIGEPKAPPVIIVETNPIPVVRSTTVRPTRTCDINALENNNNENLSAFTDTWIPPKNVTLRLGDRYFVLSVLRKVFGLSAINNDSTINNYNTIFGGSYDEFDLVRNNNDFNNVVNTTPEGYSFRAHDKLPRYDSIGLLNPIRLAITVRVCENISKVDVNILNAIRNVVSDQTITASNIPYPVNQDFSTAHSLFYPFSPISENTVKALACVADTQMSALNQWRYVLLAICASPDWQIP